MWVSLKKSYTDVKFYFYWMIELLKVCTMIKWKKREPRGNEITRKTGERASLLHYTNDGVSVNSPELNWISMCPSNCCNIFDRPNTYSIRSLPFAFLVVAECRNAETSYPEMQHMRSIGLQTVTENLLQ